MWKRNQKRLLVVDGLKKDDEILQAMLDVANDPYNGDKADKLHQMIVGEVEKNKFSGFEEIFPE